MKIKEILTSKGSDVIVIGSQAKVGELVKLLNENNLGAVVVSEDGATVSGIVSERDVIRALGESGVLEFPVAKIMTADVHTCEAGDSVSELMALMTERRIRHVPVVADGKLTGIVSIGDVVKTHVGQLEFERDQLNVYVNG